MLRTFRLDRAAAPAWPRAGMARLLNQAENGGFDEDSNEVAEGISYEEFAAHWQTDPLRCWEAVSRIYTDLEAKAILRRDEATLLNEQLIEIQNEVDTLKDQDEISEIKRVLPEAYHDLADELLPLLFEGDISPGILIITLSANHCSVAPLRLWATSALVSAIAGDNFTTASGVINKAPASSYRKNREPRTIRMDSSNTIGADIPPLQRKMVELKFNDLEADEYKAFSLAHKRGPFIKSLPDPNKYV
ncbi:uncharacterized protein P174DRAFT_416780 [Aspergillus novofumigatus IBT 16806]|uniref:Uncharacterized protein n=1 Tax=Aspergillus novofumigatus (strain IBT 16806) TaxID=1392255 RepID=A0A2I1CN83_ASPN1|nr:uncharacterized protein P174DRAFT_416780 [Aspergillus novofumigatus IBT 16806]PKX99081.1 hypothetical protein P174DRAFT_416780 [Aspergillus novofumigatus IBT 16806]